MARTAITPETTHLLSPARVDQLVVEHFDPEGYCRFPAELLAQYEGMQQRHAECEGLLQRALAGGRQSLAAGTLTPSTARLAAELDELDERLPALLEEITGRLQQRQSQLVALYRSLEPVAAVRSCAPEYGYLGAQQWLWHVGQAVEGIRRRDKRANVLAVASVLAEHARRDGVFLAGVVEVQERHGIAHSTWSRAYAWLAEQGLVATLVEARPLTLVERAVAIGTDRHRHVRRWRAVIQLQHTRRKTLRPTKWVPPSVTLGTKKFSLKNECSTGVSPVDGASRPSAAPSSRLASQKKVRRWRCFDALTTTFWKRLHALAERQTKPYKGNHPDLVVLGPVLSPQRDRIIGSLLRAGPARLLPHLKRFAHADVSPAALVVAMEAAEYRAGRDPARRTWDPTRRLIAALVSLDIDDVRLANSP